MKSERLLFLNRSSLCPSGEWDVSRRGWRLLRLGEGSAYWLGANAARELRSGEVLVVSAGARGCLRASRISAISFHYFDFSPDLLAGFLTLGERDYFEAAAKRREETVRILPTTHK